MTALRWDEPDGDDEPSAPVEFFDGPTILELVPPIWSTGDWAAQARCRPRNEPHELTEAFFPARGDGATIGRQICSKCPVREPCLEFALANPSVQGIWGGVTEAERVEMVTARLAAQAANETPSAGTAALSAGSP